MEMSDSRPAVDLSNFPENCDVDLHPNRSTNPAYVKISKFEFESLYKIYQQQNSDISFFKTENERLQAENEQCQIYKAGKAKLEKENKDLTQALESQRRNNLDKEQTVAHLQFQVKKIENDLQLEKQKVTDLLYQQQTGGNNFSNFLGFHRTTNENLSNVVADLSMQTANMHQVFQEARLKADTFLQTCYHMKAVCESAAFENEGPSERERKLMDKLRKIEAVNDMLCEERKDLERENKQLSLKLKILSATGEKVDIKELGRFKIKSRSLECSKCHESFSSVDEMEMSTCYYHKSSPVPVVLDTGIGKFWPCCERATKGNKTALGCQTGRHRHSTKRFRSED